jgi:hypothetical protein
MFRDSAISFLPSPSAPSFSCKSILSIIFFSSSYFPRGEACGIIILVMFFICSSIFGFTSFIRVDGGVDCTNISKNSFGLLLSC